MFFNPLALVHRSENFPRFGNVYWKNKLRFFRNHKILKEEINRKWLFKEILQKKIASRVYNHEIKESLKIQSTRNRHMRKSPSPRFLFFFLLASAF